MSLRDKGNDAGEDMGKMGGGRELGRVNSIID